jgi:hypothetical protein
MLSAARACSDTTDNTIAAHRHTTTRRIADSSRVENSRVLSGMSKFSGKGSAEKGCVNRPVELFNLNTATV